MVKAKAVGLYILCLPIYTMTLQPNQGQLLQQYSYLATERSQPSLVFTLPATINAHPPLKYQHVVVLILAAFKFTKGLVRETLEMDTQSSDFPLIFSRRSPAQSNSHSSELSETFLSHIITLSSSGGDVHPPVCQSVYPPSFSL